MINKIYLYVLLLRLLYIYESVYLCKYEGLSNSLNNLIRRQTFPITYLMRYLY